MNPEEIDKGVIRVPYNALFNTIGSCLVDDRSTLMLYSLIHGNAYFLEYVLVRTDLDTLLMPLLEMLYNAPKRTANQIYMLLIILLILSQVRALASAHLGFPLSVVRLSSYTGPCSRGRKAST